MEPYAEMNRLEEIALDPDRTLQDRAEAARAMYREIGEPVPEGDDATDV